MTETIIFIFRKPDPNYKSIEGLFGNISKTVGLRESVSFLTMNFSGGSPRTLWSNIKSFTKEENRIYHITGDVQYMALVTGKKSVLTVHDVKSIVNGHFLKRIYMKLFWFWLPALFVSRITVISEFTKKELEKIIPFSKNKIRVVHNPVNFLFQFSDYQFNQTKPRILLLGAKRNKNLNRVLESLKDIPCEVVLIGQPTHEQEVLAETFGLDFTYKFNLKIEDVIAEYHSCDMLCFASTYEGFGMPIIEAQSVGRPVLTSNIGAMKEVAADSALLVDPYDITSIREGVIKLIEDVDLREGLVQKGLRNVKRFSTEAVAEDYLKIYRELSV
ncbi:glycosyltransferase family 4 protein [Gelidibacter gilvus]|uniref:Glycosyltransferase family 1 protein n=1 Tax=Gelidibacter gilvus TaxID=59602 RepID=A0A4Q0XDV5_9FLAO|nr:glycosyltransferase family 1 protein [Gelidibacter gilvus]RXJ46055.1 glycosyltransferase family 1 protein [Gelidibacter gilvus]